MTVTYTLTWEEYAEAFEDRWPRPDYFSAIVVAIVALPMIAYGIALNILGPRGEPVIYGLFIVLPCFLVVATAIGVTLQARSSKAMAVEEMRRQYETWFAHEQSFSFDQEKWTHTTDAGRQESLWKGLVIAADQKSSFRLMAEEAGDVMVPKRALDPAALAELRKIALPERGDGWKFASRWMDHQATETLLLWRRRWLAMGFGNLLGLALLGWMARNWLSQQAPPFMLWGWILAAFAVVLVLAAQLWYLPLRFFLQPRHLRETMTVELSDRGVHFAMAHKSFFVAWKIIRKSEETGRVFLLYSSPSDYYLLAKRDITRDQQDEFRRMLREKVKRKPKHSMTA